MGRAEPMSVPADGRGQCPRVEPIGAKSNLPTTTARAERQGSVESVEEWAESFPAHQSQDGRSVGGEARVVEPDRQVVDRRFLGGRWRIQTGEAHARGVENVGGVHDDASGERAFGR